MIFVNVMSKALRRALLMRRWRAANPEKERANSRKSMAKAIAANPKKFRERARRWRETHPGYYTQRMREYYAANREELKARSLQCQAAHPERNIRYHHERVLRKQQASVEHFTEEQWLSLKTFYGNRCVGCGRTEEQLLCEGLKLVPDHVKALVNGGSDSIDNIQPLCNGHDGCNNHKGRKHIDYRKDLEQ